MRPLAVIHTHAVRYGENIPHMIVVCLLLAYEGGEVIPGDDMAGSKVRWASLDELESGVIDMPAPSGDPWLPRHAIETYRQLRGRPSVQLQAPL